MVQYIKYNEKEYPIKLGLHTAQRFQEKHDAEMAEVFNNCDLREDLLFYMLQQGARINRTELDLKEEDMADVLDECLTEFLEAFLKFFEDNIPEDMKKELGKIKGGGGKKKSTTSGSQAKR